MSGSAVSCAMLLPARLLRDAIGSYHLRLGSSWCMSLVRCSLGDHGVITRALAALIPMALPIATLTNDPPSGGMNSCLKIAPVGEIAQFGGSKYLGKKHLFEIDHPTPFMRRSL